MNFKRVISIILALCLVMTVAVGCGNATDKDPQGDDKGGTTDVGSTSNGDDKTNGGSTDVGGTSNGDDKTNGGSTDVGGTSNGDDKTNGGTTDVGSTSNGDDKTDGGSTSTEKKMITSKEKKRVLVIGHSFSNNSTQYASQMVADFGGNLEISSLYYAGCTLEQHYNFYTNNEAVFQLFTNGYQVTKEPVTSKWVLENHEYDYILFQGHSVSMDEIETFDKLVPLYEKVKAHQPNAQFMIHQTWSLCWRRNLGKYPAKNMGRDQFDKVEANFKIASERLGGVPIVPVGEAVQLAKESGDFSNDYGKVTSIYADEISHLSEKGRYLAACVWAQFLYKDEIDVRQTTYTGSVTKADAEKLAEIAYKAVME